MATCVVPVLVWQDYAGLFSAATAEPLADELSLVVEWAGSRFLTAVDRSAAGALKQIKACLESHCKKNAGSFQPDFFDPHLTHVSMLVRPQYRVADKVFLCEEEIELCVPCVHGRQRTGPLLCSMPTFGIAFAFHELRSLKRLATEMLRDALAHCTPQQVARMLPPKAVRLEQVTIRLPKIVSRHAAQWEPPSVLSMVAQPIGAPGFRRRFPGAWGREREAGQLTSQLRNEQASLVLVGEPGVGRSTLLVAAVRAAELAASRESGEEGGGSGRRYRFWQTSAERLVAGMRYLGQWEERCEELIAALATIDGVLCVENLLDLILTGGSGPQNSIGAFFLPYLQNGQLRLVAEATPTELEACRRHLPGLVDAMQVVCVAEMDFSRALHATDQLCATLVRDTKVELEEHVTTNILRLFRRFLPYQALPGPAVRFTRNLFEQAKQISRKNIAASDAVTAFIQETGLPEFILRDERPLPMEEIAAILQNRVIGQPEACHTAATLVCRLKSGLNDPNRPLGVLLFCGPTGVGKTELVKALADYLFGHGQNTDRLVRLDMSEYSSPWAAQRLLAKDDRTPSDLVSRIRQQPFTVVLLDEIEKAAPEVFDMMLGMLDEGRLSDPYGRTTTFRSAIIIMTSNLGAKNRKSIGFLDCSHEIFDAEARAFFRPEFYNRLDAVVTFRSLDPDVCLAITRKELSEIGRREGIAKADLVLSFSDRLVESLATQGFDARYGARPLQRTIEAKVVSSLSRFLTDHPGLRETRLQVDVTSTGDAVVRIA